MRKIALAATVAALALTSAAQAGPDGFYVGVSVGHDFGNVEGVNTNAGGLFPGAYDYDPSGASIGALAGYNFVHDNLVFGLEGDINWSDVSDEAGFTSTFPRNYIHTTEINWTAAGRARIGIIHGNNVVYVAGGYAMADVEHEINQVGFAVFHSYSDTQSGWTLGGGVDHDFGDGLSGRIEYRYTNYGEVTDNSGVNSIDTNELTTHAVRGALIMKF